VCTSCDKPGYCDDDDDDDDVFWCQVTWDHGIRKAGNLIFRQGSLRQVFQISYVQGTRCFKMMVAVWSDGLLYVFQLQLL